MRPDFKLDREETHERKVFLDTNVLIYAAAGDKVRPGKFAKAGEILTDGNLRDIDSGGRRIRHQRAEPKKDDVSPH